MNPVRRVVTGHDDERRRESALGRRDRENASAATPACSPISGIRAKRRPTSAPAPSIADPGDEPHVTPPPPGGSRFVVIDYPPGNTGTMHRTETIDYIVVIAGEIDMEMDDSTVHLRAGDTMIQRGTNHAWFNRGTEVARVAFVLVDAKPLNIGHARTS